MVVDFLHQKTRQLNNLDNEKVQPPHMSLLFLCDIFHLSKKKVFFWGHKLNDFLEKNHQISIFFPKKKELKNSPYFYTWFQ
jgi:hypothetical protein